MSVSWGQRWLTDVAGIDPDRPGQVARPVPPDQVVVEPAAVTALVREGRRGTLRARITVGRLDDDRLAAVATAAAADLRATAAVLDGGLPEDPASLGPDGARLLPDPGSVGGRCQCTAAQPCPHVRSLHLAFAARLDRDPLLLLDLQGRARETLAAAVRRQRAGEEGVVLPGTVPLRELGTVDLDRPQGDLGLVGLHPRPVDDPAWLFHHLGDPPGVDDTAPFEATIERAARFAWRLAAGEGADAADEQVLLAELRGQRVATAAAVATALGWDDERAAEELDRLFEAGRVLRTGSGDRARYRAP